MEALKYAHGNGCPWDQMPFTTSRMYAHEIGCLGNKYGRTCEQAADGGHLETLKYAHENGCPWDEDNCKNAAANGHLEILQYAHEI
jgi:hypothetical protein